MININIVNNKVLIDEKEYTPSTQILGVYIDITDSTSFIMGFEILTKRYSISEILLDNQSFNDSQSLKDYYYTVLDLQDPIYEDLI
jgi:hypothetical protein